MKLLLLELQYWSAFLYTANGSVKSCIELEYILGFLKFLAQEQDVVLNRSATVSGALYAAFSNVCIEDTNIILTGTELNCLEQLAIAACSI